ncbi:MAG: hypothetical protein KGI08_09305 [Thaumarchaeota archaeon]|nr:hypothetical protein [Nitrososphaerota archaeon]
MSSVECFAILDIRPQTIITNVNRLANGPYAVNINLEESGHFKISLNPQLSAADKTTLTNLCSKVALVIINP